MGENEENPEVTRVIENAENPKFIREQYSQYWEMKRFHLTLSWQIPTLAIVAVVAFLGFDPAALTKWMQAPLVPAITFLLVGMFIVVMFVHHRRNLLFARLYERAVADFERDYGVKVDLHHFQVQPKLRGWQGVSSSSMLSALLLLLAVALLGTSVYFFAMSFLW